MPTSMHIGISGICIEMIIGVKKEERLQKQKVFIDIDCRVLVDGFKSLDQTLDYEILHKLCHKLAKENQYELLETFAKDILDKILEIKNISHVKITVNKPSAFTDSKSAYVTIFHE